VKAGINKAWIKLSLGESVKREDNSPKFIEALKYTSYYYSI